MDFCENVFASVNFPDFKHSNPFIFISSRLNFLSTSVFNLLGKLQPSKTTKGVIPRFINCFVRFKQ